MTGEQTRVAVWPLWAVPLGLWIPLEFTFHLQSYLLGLWWYEIIFAYASIWALHALVVGLACGALALGLHLVLRCAPDHWRARIAALLLLVSRVLLGVVLWSLFLAWVAEVAPRRNEDFERYQWLAILLCIVAATWVTWRFRQPGPLLLLARKVARAGAIVALISLPTEALLNLRDTAKQPPTGHLAAGQKPDVILISVDALAAGHMSLYGYERPTTPYLEAFAGKSVVFDRYYANSNWTLPSVASFLHGVQPWTHRAHHTIGGTEPSVRGNHLIQRFHDAGYRVMTVATNSYASPASQKLMPWVDEAEFYAVHSYSSYVLSEPARWLPSMAVNIPFAKVPWVMELFERAVVKAGWADPNDHFAPEIALSEAREMLSKPSDAPRLLWVHLLAPHDPYAATPPYLGSFDPAPTRRTRFDSSPPHAASVRKDPTWPQSYVGRYDESIRMVDDAVGRFLAWMDSRGELDPALVVITADHGESFGRGYGGHGGPLLSEELIHIPLIIKRPNSRAGTHNATLAQQVDLAPTLLQLVDLPALAQQEGVPLDLDADGGAQRAVYSMNFEMSGKEDALTSGSMAVLQDRWKYVHHFNARIATMREDIRAMFGEELYDLAADPREQHNLAAREREVAARLDQQIQAVLQEHGKALH